MSNYELPRKKIQEIEEIVAKLTEKIHDLLRTQDNHDEVEVNGKSVLVPSQEVIANQNELSYWKGVLNNSTMIETSSNPESLEIGVGSLVLLKIIDTRHFSEEAIFYDNVCPIVQVSVVSYWRDRTNLKSRTSQYDEITIDSALGKALVGKTSGQTVVVNDPDRENYKALILAIDNRDMIQHNRVDNSSGVSKTFVKKGPWSSPKN